MPADLCIYNGIGNRFIRCRAWRNSDDAWDLYETDYDVVLAECWAWESGKAEDYVTLDEDDALLSQHRKPS